MKAKLIIYWLTTTFIALETLAGGFVDLTRGRTNVFSGPFVVDVVTHLGYPVYVLAILGVWKIPGAIVLLLPRLPRLKEWAYAGIIFELTGAIASWLFTGDRAGQFIAPLILAVLAMTSWALRPPSRRWSPLASHQPNQRTPLP
jgi:DoxX-like family